MSELIDGLIIGLTGGIGSGKSAAADEFARLGAAVVDTDVIAHELTGPRGNAMPVLRREFGDSVIAADGSLDRGAMRRLAFTQPEARRRLEALLHPMIGATADRRCHHALSAGAPYVVLVVPLLVENAGYRRRVDRVVVVDCDDDVRVGRIMKRSGLSRSEAEAIMAAQASRKDRLAIADDVLMNDADLASLRAQVADLHWRYQTIAEKKCNKSMR